MYSDRKWRGKRFRIIVFACLSLLVLTILICILKLTHHESQKDKHHHHQLQISLSSERKIYNLKFSSWKVNDIDQFIEQSNSLSADLMRQLDRDIAKSNVKPSNERQKHRDFIHHNHDQSINAGICTHPYEILILCLDNTNTTTREMYRNTWASTRESILTSDGYEALNWKIIFVVDIESDATASNLEFENELRKYKDMIGIKDSLQSTGETLKLMSSLEWVDDNCDYSFLVKMKSGMFLNTPKLFSFMNDQRIPNTDLYAGLVNYDTNITSTFHTKDKSLTKRYPRFIEGAFVLSFDVVDKIIKKFNWERPHQKPDVYVGELVLQSGVDVWPIVNFFTRVIHKECDPGYIQDFAFLESSEACMKEFMEDSLKLIPEI